jgi:broad specificity phosphatase PhoE
LTTFLLIRHGLTDAVGQRITGRLPGVFLNATGREQAAGLPERLRRWKIDAIYSSPLERTMETAGAVADKLGLSVRPNAAFLEFDFGDWSGVSIAELDQRADWKSFCQFRSSTRAPEGELITEVQTRVVTGLTALCEAHPDRTVAVFSHADAIKAALLHYLPAPADNINRLVVDPASISVLTLYRWGPVISGVNLY